MNRYISLFICLLMTTNMFAENERSLCVILKKDMLISLPVSEHPKIMFDGSVMHVGDGDYQIENVRKWMIGDPEEIADGIEIKQTQKAIMYKDGVLKVGAIKDVRIYNTAGIEMPVNIKNGSIDLSEWPQDVYLIKVGRETFKIRKR